MYVNVGRDSVQKLRASRCQDEAEEMRCQLAERDAVISDLEAEIDSVRAQRSQLTRDKQQTDDQLAALQMSAAQPHYLL